MFKISPERTWPLHGIAASREIEHVAQAGLPAHTLMQRAGLAVARLARAIAPHGRHAWIACGPGNNGGDGFEAAVHLHRLGWRVTLTWTGTSSSPADAQASRERALGAGLAIATKPPAHFDLAIDALLGLGGDLSPSRAGSALMNEWLSHMHASGAPVLAVDLPTGLNADTGAGAAPPAGKGPRHTLSLLSLKPGLFTAEGRDQAGEIWFDPLGLSESPVAPTAWLFGTDRAGATPKAMAAHASHKGSFGEVFVVGGQQSRGPGTSMAGAALLAARAALTAGTGRVYVALLGEPDLCVDVLQPELMFRPVGSLHRLQAHQVVVAGCGGGEAIADVLPDLLAQPASLVLDADALNAVAANASLRRALIQRHQARQATVITPHPLEAARLLETNTSQVQADRLQAAQALAQELSCVVVLKGSGTVVAAPGELPCINFTGNALLATAGTGDVLAGLLGAAMAHGLDPLTAALHAVHEHGKRADEWARSRTARLLTASELARNTPP